MIASRPQLISSLIRKKLYEDIDQILSMLRQGFDVFVQIEFPEVKGVLIELLENELKKEAGFFRIFDGDNLQHAAGVESLQKPLFMPTVVVGEKNITAGCGFVHYLVHSPDQLLGNVASGVETILIHFNLEFYIDVFDAKKLSRLKQIARVQGMRALIDAVVQTAYYGGYKGDADAAQSYLDKSEFLTGTTHDEDGVPLENCAKKFLSHVVSYGEDAHSFMKSCLSYYVVSKQGHTMTRASQILSISRTTLQEHLKIAQNLGVSSFFSGTHLKSMH